MSQKSFIWLGMSVGSALGGFVPRLWDASYFSLWGILFTGLGGFLGIYIGFKLSEMTE